MITTRLEISPAAPSSTNGTSPCVGLHRGGPAVLLRWLETQLGLEAPEEPAFRRVAELAATLEALPGASFEKSRERDPWGTATELLDRWDELRLAGWSGAPHPDLPPLATDLGAAIAARPLTIPGPVERLDAVLATLGDGQVLPPHRCVLYDEPDQWPARWRPVLEHLHREPAPSTVAGARPMTNLESLQTALLHPATAPPEPTPATDGTIRHLVTHSIAAAVDAVAAMLAADPDALAGTVVCCADPSTAARLDDRLARRGLPTMGAAATTVAHPARQVLPLALELCWQPVDPDVLLTFLTLPLCPIPKRAAGRLARALAQQPGLGSGAWERALAELRDPDDEATRATAETVSQWLDLPRVSRGLPLPAATIASRCQAVAAWATRRAAATRDEHVLTLAFRTAANEAVALEQLLADFPDGLTAPQLERILAAVAGAGIEAPAHLEAAGGPRWVRTLADLDEPCDRLVWLGLESTADAPTRWSRKDRTALQAAGIDLDDGSRALSARRTAERRGLLMIRQRLLAIGLPGSADDDRPPHPLWLQGLTAVRAEEIDLEGSLSAAGTASLSPWTLPVEPIPQQRRATPPTVWSLPPELLHDRDTTSATELETRLACPARWVMSYAARIQAGPIAGLPEGHRLAGTFGHQVLQEVLGDGGPLPTPDAAEQAVRRVIDERLPLDAAPLALQARVQERIELTESLVRTARELVRDLATGGYRVVDMEARIQGEVDGRALSGRIDCLVAADDGAEAVIDLKHSGRDWYAHLLAEGRAVQLATYAEARRQQVGRQPAAAYLILSRAELLNPAGSSLRGIDPTVPDAPSVGATWAAFSQALRAAEGWLTDGRVPVRPRQDRVDWPPGAEIVLDPVTTRKGDVPPPCSYCDLKLLCGLEPVR